MVCATVTSPSNSFGAADPIIEPPPDNGRPTVIKVGVYILNLVALDEASQTFSCTGYVTETWQDPRLAFAPGAGQPLLPHYRKQDLRFPLLQFDNSVVPRTLSSYRLVGPADGTIRSHSGRLFRRTSEYTAAGSLSDLLRCLLSDLLLFHSADDRRGAHRVHQPS